MFTQAAWWNMFLLGCCRKSSVPEALTSPLQEWPCGAALGEPALQGKPLCVSHSASSKGAGEVSSANYEARAFGVKAGMFISEAKRLCPDIIVMPYFFEKYEAISEKVQ